MALLLLLGAGFATAAAAADISGTVFEDVNYGGGAGRGFATSGGIGRQDARVELYDSSGNFLSSTLTDAAGVYSFPGLANGIYTVRVVNNSVSSSRIGYIAGLLPVQTFRTNGLSGNVGTGDPDRVGGENPTVEDAGAGAIGATIDPATGVFIAGISGQAQSITTVNATTALTGIDFGFNFDTIVNVNDAGQGSLRQFISNANALDNTGLAQSGLVAGRETSIFMISDGQLHAGLRAGLADQLTGSVAVITVVGVLPAISDRGTTIDGTTQTINIDDTNRGTLGTGGTVGTGPDGIAGTGDEQPLAQVNRPEVQLNDSGLHAARGLDIQADDVTIRALAIYGFANNRLSGVGEANIRVGAVTGAIIEQNVLGTTAMSFTDPGAVRTLGDNITLVGPSGAIVRNNLIGYAGYMGVLFVGGSVGGLVEGNEIRGNGTDHANQDGVSFEGGSGTGTARGNLIIGTEGNGIDMPSSSGGNVVYNNTVTGNGIGTDLSLETPGVRILGNNNLVDRNILTANFGAGVMVRNLSTGNRITRNSIYANGTITNKGNAGPSGQIGIDLHSDTDDPKTGTDPFVTLNDNDDTDAGGNNRLNYPVLESATIIGGNLVVTGFARPDSVIEFFIAAPDPRGFGEGRTFAFAATEGSLADADGSTGTYTNPVNGIDQGTDTTNRFSFTVALPPGVVPGSALTATATDAGNNTSEFSGLVTVAGTGTLSGTVFEDVNYGGGAGRDRTAAFAAGGSGRDGARVELYDSGGAFIASTPTSGGGNYSFANLLSGTYTVRVVNASVGSARAGFISGTHLAVQTYRTGASTGGVVAVTDHVGGQDPTITDAAAGFPGVTMDIATGNFTTGITGTAQSITNVTVSASDIASIDFGYNFDTIVNTNDSGQGSLRQFIINANGLDNSGLAQAGLAAGRETSIFMISDGRQHDGLRSGLTDQLTGGVAVINVTSALPLISASGTTIDGTTQTTNVDDTNNGALGAGGTVGTGADGVAGTGDEPVLPQVNRPEVQIQDASNLPTGLDIGANDTTVRGIAIHGFGNGPFNDGFTDIKVGTGSQALTGILIERNYVGTTATAFTDPGAGARTNGDGIRVNGGVNGVIRGNLIGFANASGISILYDSNGWTVTGNEIRGNSLGPDFADGIGIDTTSGHAITANLIAGNVGMGIDAYLSTGVLTITDNTVIGNGVGANETAGLRLFGSGSSVRHNLIDANFGPGVLVVSTAATNIISQNSIFANGGIGVDLLNGTDDISRGTPPFVTVNDNGDSDSGGNSLLNFPVITSASIVGSNLVLSGFARSGSAIEFYIADPDPSRFGEGRTYLVTLVEGSGADADVGTGTYTNPVNGLNQGTDTADRFAFTIPMPAGVTGGAQLTSTATLGGETSEFGGVAQVLGGITVTPTSGLVTTESGSTATFTVVLNSRPTADVVVGLSSSDTTEGTISTSSLTFTDADWSDPQTVTVTGVDDLVADGDIPYTIITAAAVSTDPAYNLLDPADVSVTNIDDGGAASGSAIAEIDPSTIVGGAIGRVITLHALITVAPTDSGIDGLVVSMPGSFTNVSLTGLTVGGAPLVAACPTPGPNQYCATLSGADWTIILGSRIGTGTTAVSVTLQGDVPDADTTGDFALAISDSMRAASAAVASAGNADGNATNANTLTLTTLIVVVDGQRSSIAAAPPIVLADGATASVVTAVLRDQNGVPLPGRTVEFTSSRGVDDVFSAITAVTDSNGVATTLLTSLVPGTTQISARDAGSGISVTGTAAVTFIQGEALQLTKRAAPALVQPGQVVVFKIELRNTSARALSSIRVQDYPDAGLSYVEGSARLDGVPLTSVTQIGNGIEFAVGAVDAPVDQNSNGHIDPGEPGYRVISYAVRVGATARPGFYGNRAHAIDLCDTCIVGPPVRTEVEVRADPVFDLGTVIGKVFFDRNGNGIQDPDDPGMAAAMVALDDGTYSLTDAFGRYHFPAVEPGQRLVKLNLATVAGNARVVGRTARILSVTPGLLVKANFPVQYAAEAESVGRPPQYGAELQAEAALAPDDVRGSTRMFTVLVNGREAALPRREVRLVTRRMDDVVETRAGGEPLALRFDIGTSTSRKPPLHWRFVIRASESSIVREWNGDGEPPRTLLWDGRDAAELPIEPGKVYFYQLDMEYPGGLRVSSPLRIFGLNKQSVVMLDLKGGAFRSGSAELTGEAHALLDQLAGIIRQYPDEQIVIAGHTDSNGSEEYNQGLSQRRAQAAFEYLTSVAQLPAGRFSVVGYGESRSIATNLTPEGRELNRRVEIRGQISDIERAKLHRQERPTAHVVLNGVGVRVDEDGRFAAVSQARDAGSGPSEQFDITMSDEFGRSVEARILMPRIELSSTPADQRMPFPGTAGQNPNSARGYAGQMEYRIAGQTDAGNRMELDGEPIAVDTDGRFQLLLTLSPGDNRYVLTSTNNSGFVRYGNLNIRMLIERDGQAIIAVPPIPSLSVDLPPRHIPLKGGRLIVPGVTDVGNRVTVNGQPVDVAEDGRFLATVELKPGINPFRAEVIDREGNIGAIERDIQAREAGLFMLALADGKISQIERSGAASSNETITEGRVAFYLKGQVRGKYLLTAAFDSGTSELDKLFSDLDRRDNDRLLTNIDPDTIYPVYGDSSELVYDAQSQGTLYLALTSEQLEVLIGNYALNFSDTELAAYQRTLYGARLTYRSRHRTTQNDAGTELQVIAANAQQLSIRDEISATGGSLYFLSHQDVIEGSEQITLLIHDQNTGLLLQQLPQQRNVDYTIQYVQGRVYFNRPLQSIADATTLIGPSPLGGNPVSVQIDYATHGVSDSGSTMAGRGRQRLFDGKIALGVTYVSDDQGLRKYELGGVDAEFKSRGTRIVTEIARSDGTDSSVFASTDGGLTYSSRVSGSALRADAFKLAGELDIGEWFNKPGRFLASAYYKELGAGFAANQSFALLDTEQTGGSFTWIANPGNRVSMRVDQLTSGPDTRTQAAAQWRHDTKRISFVTEIQDRTAENASLAADDVTQAAARVIFHPGNNLALALTHMETLTGDGGQETGAEAEWRIKSGFGLRGRAVYGDRGDAAELSATYELPFGSLYLGKKLRDFGQSTASSTVVGAVMPIEGGKAYTEYEWGSADDHPAGRTVAGIQRDWRKASGLAFLLSAEKSTADVAVTTDDRWAVAAGVAYDGGAGLKLSSRNEWRRQDGAGNFDQFISVNAADWKFRDDLTLLGRLRIGDTQDDLDPLRSLRFTEASAGLAYRPVRHDRFAALMRLTRRDESPTAGQVTGDVLPNVSDVFSADWSYQLTPRFEWVGKQAIRYRTTRYEDLELDSTTMLSILRLNTRLWRDFAIGLEARRLAADESSDAASGWLAEIGWERFEHMRIGVGYNFTDFSDDLLRNRGYSERGMFLRLQGVY